MYLYIQQLYGVFNRINSIKNAESSICSQCLALCLECTHLIYIQYVYLWGVSVVALRIYCVLRHLGDAYAIHILSDITFYFHPFSFCHLKFNFSKHSATFNFPVKQESLRLNAVQHAQY